MLLLCLQTLEQVVITLNKMSFKNYKSKIDEGDTVILYLSNTLYAIDVRPEIKNKKGDMVENVFQTTFGALKVRNLIGTEFGSRVQLSKGWGHVLQPTPELWSLTVPHRTQIIYTPDISMIMLQLDLVPGSVVVEAGTGSGSLTHALIRRVRPHGHVYTFDFHEYRAKLANEEFESHGIAEYVTAQHRDVLQEGFGGELKGKADAVFLDLPSPWTGVPHAVDAIKEQGMGSLILQMFMGPSVTYHQDGLDAHLMISDTPDHDKALKETTDRQLLSSINAALRPSPETTDVRSLIPGNFTS